MIKSAILAPSDHKRLHIELPQPEKCSYSSIYIFSAILFPFFWEVWGAKKKQNNINKLLLIVQFSGNGKAGKFVMNIHEILTRLSNAI